MLACMDDQQLPGMPHPWPLRVTRTGDGRAVAVHAGPLLLSAFGAADLEMRDLVICSLTEGSRHSTPLHRTTAGVMHTIMVPARVLSTDLAMMAALGR